MKGGDRTRIRAGDLAPRSSTRITFTSVFGEAPASGLLSALRRHAEVNNFAVRSVCVLVSPQVRRNKSWFLGKLLLAGGLQVAQSADIAAGMS